MRVYIHTLHNYLLRFDPKTRLPRNYIRFKGLLEEVLRDGRSKNDLIVMDGNINLKGFMSILRYKRIIGLSSKGETVKLQEIMNEDVLKENLVLIIGAFPRGHFSMDMKDVITDLISIYHESLEAWIVASRVLAQIEMVYGLV